ncbi:MAG: hypothetical protein OEY59_04800 [Deltaproteobacteria bacterium]|nr:hypothetical protein [Deltaproteobacteria bacterium]
MVYFVRLVIVFIFLGFFFAPHKLFAETKEPCSKETINRMIQNKIPEAIIDQFCSQTKPTIDQTSDAQRRKSPLEKIKKKTATDISGKKLYRRKKITPPTQKIQERVTPIYVSPKSGINIGYDWGKASVFSYVVDQDGTRRELANGMNSYEAYWLSYRAPYEISDSGFDYFFYPKYISSRIIIRDFRKDIPMTQIAGTNNIPAIVTDFQSGQSFDIQEPNQYDIEMSSAGYMAEVSYMMEPFYSDAIFGYFVQYNFMLSIGTSLVEYRDVKVSLEKVNYENQVFDGLKYYTINLSTGMLINSLFIGFGVDYLNYPNLPIPNDMEFRDIPRFNSEKDAYERKRVFVDSVDFQVTHFSVVLNYAF